MSIVLIFFIKGMFKFNKTATDIQLRKYFKLKFCFGTSKLKLRKMKVFDGKMGTSQPVSPGLKRLKKVNPGVALYIV